jgi:3-oxo-5-alpha-steroid 4-dehydrogenase 3
MSQCVHTLQGILAFLAGNALQCHSHCILATLQLRIAQKRGDALRTTADGYALPEGGAFSLVSCPHYLGEIVIYCGLALVASGSNICIWIVLAWVVRSLPCCHAGLIQRPGSSSMGHPSCQVSSA